jgi:uncharacterized membrane protein required for colicin V production
MATIFPLALLVILVAFVAFSYTEGLWANALRVVNVITAALLATNFFEPVARLLEGLSEAIAPYASFVALWAVFLVSYMVLQILTDMLSRSKVRFMMVVDRAGSVFFSLWTGWVMVCFTAMTLHTAPLAEKFMWGGFDPSVDKKMFFGTAAPDRQWLAFAQKVSLGAFSRKLAEGEQGYGDASDPDEAGLAVFDRNGEFIREHATFRKTLESEGMVPPR